MNFGAEPTHPLAAAVLWLRLLLTGSLATGLAILAVGVFGMLLLNGRIDWRRGASVILGCFLIFGASSIATGLLGATASLATPPVVSPPPPVIAQHPMFRPTPMPTPQPRPNGYDPYAGAALIR